MGIFKIDRDVVKPVADAIADVRKTKITGERAQEEKQDIEMTSAPETNGGKKFSVSKVLVDACLVGIIALGGYCVLKKPVSIPAYVQYVGAVMPILGIFIVVVGGGRAFKNSKWSKDL